MSGSSALSGGGLDFGKYTPYSNYSNINLTDSNWHTIINISGGGYIKKWLVWFSQNYTLTTKITIDGVVIYNGFCTNSVNGCLVCGDDIYKYYTDFYTPVFDNTTIKGSTKFNGYSPYPYTSGGNCSSKVGNEIFFKQSLLIEVSTNITPLTCYYNFLGGVL